MERPTAGIFACMRVRRALHAFLDGEAEPQRAEYVAAHLEQCSRCRIEADVVRQVIAAIRRQRPDLDAETHARLAAAIDRLVDPPRTT